MQYLRYILPLLIIVDAWILVSMAKVFMVGRDDSDKDRKIVNALSVTATRIKYFLLLWLSITIVVGLVPSH